MQEQKNKEILQKKENKPASYYELKKEAGELRTRLDQLDAEKEKWFAKREEFSQQIKKEIQKIKQTIQERDALSSSVREEKIKRNDLNKTISEKIKEIKQSPPKPEAVGKIARTANADDLRRQMHFLEKKVETEGLSFEKEKAVMKRINILRKQYEEAKKGHEEEAKTKQLFRDIVGLKKQANDVHRVMEQNAMESQKRHEEMVMESKKINELKKGEKEAHEKFIELKRQFNDLNTRLKYILPGLEKFREEQKMAHLQKQKHFEEQRQESIEEMAKSVEEKLKSGKKLTLKDLIVFQGAGK